MMRILRRIRYRLALIAWAVRGPGYRPGDPHLGSGEQRRANIDLILARHYAKRPIPAEFGL